MPKTNAGYMTHCFATGLRDQIEIATPIRSGFGHLFHGGPRRESTRLRLHQ